MPSPSNPRASANRRVMNSVHGELAMLARELEAGRSPAVYEVIKGCIRTLEAGQATDLRHQRNEEGVLRPAKSSVIASDNVLHVLAGDNAPHVSVQQELHSLRRLADGYHQRLARIETYLSEEAGFQEMDNPVATEPHHPACVAHGDDSQCNRCNV